MVKLRNFYRHLSCNSGTKDVSSIRMLRISHISDSVVIWNTDTRTEEPCRKEVTSSRITSTRMFGQLSLLTVRRRMS